MLGQVKKDTKEHVTPIAAKLKEGRSVIRPVSQVTLRLKPIEGKDRYASTVDSILRWMAQRAGKTLPNDAWQRRSFELSDIGAQRTAAVALVEPRYWAARLDDADKIFPLRTWITEIGVGIDSDGDTLFGARLVCANRGAEVAFDRSIPGFVKQVITAGPAELNGQLLSKQVRLLTSEDEIDDLVRLMEDPRRHCDVIIFSLPENSLDVKDAAASVKAVHDGTLGSTHVFAITGAASFFLTDRVGRELSVFHRGVRTYRPGFRSWIDQPSNHPLALSHRIVDWPGGGAQAFERWLINQSLANTVYGIDRERELPGFNAVRQHAAMAERKNLKEAGGSDVELLKLFEQDNDQLRKELQEQKEQYDGLLATADTEREMAIQDANAARSLALERLNRIRLLDQRLAEISQKPVIAIPESLNLFEDWCKEHLVGSVEMTNRAYQGIRKSNYHDPQFIYRSLLLLRDFYVPMRIDNSAERRQLYEGALADLQLEESSTGEGVKYAADLYSVQYGGSRRSLDRHLKGGDSRDRRYGFRLYFFWDDDEQIVVVGWLPSHLDNRGS